MKELEEKYVKQFGTYIKELRQKQGWSIIEVGERLDLSSNYISLMERGLRVPTDETIEKLGALYQEDEDKLYHLLGKIPKSVLIEVDSNPMLQTLLSYARKKKISEEKRKAMEDEILRVFAEFLDVNKDEFKDE